MITRCVPGSGSAGSEPRAHVSPNEESLHRGAPRRFHGLLVTLVAAMMIPAACGETVNPDTDNPAPREEADEPPRSELDDGNATHEVELATVGIDMLTRSPIVLLREPRTAKVVPIWVGDAEARAIWMAMNEIDTPRPMTHDLMVSLLREMDAELVSVVVDDLRDNTYHAKLKIKVGSEEEFRIVDTRPSDGMALAVRTGASIHVAQSIIDASPEFDFLPPDEDMQVVRAMGITVVVATEEHREQFKLPPDVEGVLVTDVAGRARRRGLQRGDLIVQIDDEAVTSPMAFFEAVRAVRPGGVVSIRYQREGEEKTVDIRVDDPVPFREGERRPSPGQQRI